MHINKICSGAAFDIYALEIRKICQAQEYISSLELKDKKKITALINFISENGPPTNKEKFNPIGDNIYELKTGGGIRILSFFGGSSLAKSLILTHGFPKPKKRRLKQEKKKAVGWRKEYFRIIDKGDLLKKGEK
jgi:phage-related protein